MQLLLCEKILGKYCFEKYKSILGIDFEKTMTTILNARSIGIFGGSFNPMHEGHMMVAERALELLDIDLVILMVSRSNSFKPKYDLSVLERADGCIEFIKDKSGKILVSSLEEDIKSNSTYDLVKNIVKDFKNINLTFIMGADCALKFHLWNNYEDILKIVKIAIFERPRYMDSIEKECKILNYDNVSVYRGKAIDISSTEIRNRKK
jgi:nicotinate-nucleotide adenylyltransferase